MRITAIFVLSATTLIAGCTQNNVQEDQQLKKYFQERNLEGTFGLFDNGHGTFTIHGLQDFTGKKYAPGPTFHLVDALIGLEIGTIPDISSTLFSDSSDLSECNGANNLLTAFRSSCDNWFVQLNQLMDLQKFKFLLDTMGYASGKGGSILKGISGTFWNDSIAKVTADEQLGLVKKLYFNKLPLQKRTQEEAKKIMIKEADPNYSKFFVAGGGWIIGWIEENQHPYFFSLYAQPASGGTATNDQVQELLNAMLRHYTFMHGKK